MQRRCKKFSARLVRAYVARGGKDAPPTGQTFPKSWEIKVSREGTSYEPQLFLPLSLSPSAFSLSLSLSISRPTVPLKPPTSRSWIGILRSPREINRAVWAATRGFYGRKTSDFKNAFLGSRVGLIPVRNVPSIFPIAFAVFATAKLRTRPLGRWELFETLAVEVKPRSGWGRISECVFRSWRKVNASKCHWRV